MIDFEWDDTKAESNERKHSVSFTEAMTVFADPLSLTGYDPDHSENEDRYITMGLSAAGRLLLVSHPDSDDELRPNYDFRALRGVVRGKYAARYRERLRMVRLADDMAAAFADEAAVNNALREYLRDHPAEQNRATRETAK